LPLAVLGLGILACGSPPGESAAKAKKLPRIESQELGIAIGAVPAIFDVVSSEGGEVHLRRHEGEGDVRFEIQRPEIGGVNLIEIVRDWKEKYLAMPAGKFLGQVELTTQLGPAYTVRGSYEQDGKALEERRIFCLHPDGDKVLTLVYTYPEGNSSRTRTDELVELLTELEPLDHQAP
jgi:hypothetical protein